METKKGADALEHWLCMNGFPATTIHGDRTQQVSWLEFRFIVMRSDICFYSCLCLVFMSLMTIILGEERS